MSKDTLKRKRKPPQKDISGKKFGHLVVLSMKQDLKRNPKGQYFAVCHCLLCGCKDFDTLPYNLRRGRTTSCGCRRDQYEKITGENSKQFTGHKEIRGKTWNTFKRRSKRRGHKFDLDIKEAWKLYEEQGRCCALTGVPIVFGKHNSETTASLDRLDCKIGYRKGNVQWVHKHVNIMRNVFSLEYFFEVCRLVTHKRRKQCVTSKAICSKRSSM